MTNRSPAVSLALLVVPTMCIIALRLGIPALDEVISNDFTLEATLHVIAILVGLFMVSRYSRIEDHEYHRSKAIGRLSKTYKSEDRGLWDERSDKALQKLEAKANSPSKRASKKLTKRMSGSVGSLNTEMSETEVEDGYEAEVRVSGMQTIVDEEAIEETKQKQSKTSFSSLLSSSLDRSAERRLQKMKNKQEKAKIKTQKKLAKKESKSKAGNSPWDGSATTSTVKSVISCSQCGVLNNRESQYCTSCGNLLIH